MSTSLRTSRKKLVACFFFLLPLLWATESQAQCTVNLNNQTTYYWSQITTWSCTAPTVAPTQNGVTYTGNYTITGLGGSEKLVVDIDVTIEGNLTINSNGSSPKIVIAYNKSLRIIKKADGTGGNLTDDNNNVSYEIQTGGLLWVEGTLKGKNNNLFSGGGTIGGGALEVGQNTSCGPEGCPTMIFETCNSGDAFCNSSNQCAAGSFSTGSVGSAAVTCGSTPTLNWTGGAAGTTVASWQYSVAPFTNWIDLKSGGSFITTSSYTVTTPLYAETRYRVKVKSANSNCYLISGVGTVTMSSGIVNSLTGSPICQGNGVTTSYSPPVSGTYTWTVSGAGNIVYDALNNPINKSDNITTGMNPVTVEWDPGFYGTATITAASTGCNTYRWTVTVIPSTGGWKGITNDWFVGSNWCSGVVPTATTDVVINAGTGIIQPVIDAAKYPNGVLNALCRDLYINTGASLTLVNKVQGQTTTLGKLDIYGDFTNNGSLTSNVGTIAFTGTISQSVNTNASFYNLTINKTSGDIAFYGNLTINGAYSQTAGSTTSFKGSTLQTISATNNISFTNLTINNSGGESP